MSLDAAPWPRIGIMGGGAVGCLYGAFLARSGAPVSIVARPRHAEALNTSGVRVTGRVEEFAAPVRSSSDPAILAESDLVLFCTKTGDTETAAAAIKSHLPKSATILAFQNGIEGAERLAAALDNPVFPAALIVSCEMAGPGVVQHNGAGAVRLGEWFEDAPHTDDRRARLEQAVAVFGRAGVDIRIEPDIRATMWTKLAMNCAYNAVSALGRARYARLAFNESSVELMGTVVRELIAVAAAEGVPLDFDAVFTRVLELGDTMGTAISSTGQDIAAGRRTEIEDLNGCVVRRGLARGVPTPVNDALVRLVRILERAPADPAFYPRQLPERLD